MQRTRIVFLISLIVFLAFYTIIKKHAQNESLREVASGETSSNYNKELFEGKWYSSRSKDNINIYLNGRWEDKKLSGNWSLQGDYIAWTYDNIDPYGTFDKNYIVSVNSNRIVFKELDGSTTIFNRLK